MAAHAAAGMAKAGSSAETTMTRSLLLPRAAVWKASSARASAKGSRPAMSVVRTPGGRATSPTRTTCAPPAALAPSGRRAASASREASGSVGTVGEQDRGAHGRRGQDRSGDAGAPVARRRSARRRRGGSRASWRGRPPARRRPRWRSGRRPPMRVVFFVAKAGKPRSVDGLGLRALDAQAGRLVGPPCPSSCGRRGRTPTAASAASRQARTAAGRRIRRPTVRKAGDDCAGHPAPPARVEDIA